MKIFKTVLIIILCLVLGGGATYYYFEVYNQKDNTIPVKKEEQKKETTEELDVDSRLVKELYGMVFVENLNNTWNADWMFSNTSNNRELKSFNVEDGSEDIKMHLVGININNINREYIDCNNNVPDSFEKYGESICKRNKDRNQYESQYGYSREYVESIYKKLFGPDATVDTSVPFRSYAYEMENYVYVDKLDKYVLYAIDGGGTTGPGGYKFTVESATKKEKEVQLDVKVVKTEYEDDMTTVSKRTNYKFVYTFKLETDGMYSFVGRELIN